MKLDPGLPPTRRGPWPHPILGILPSRNLSLFLAIPMLCGSLSWHCKYNCMNLNKFFQCMIWVESTSLHITRLLYNLSSKLEYFRVKGGLLDDHPGLRHNPAAPEHWGVQWPTIRIFTLWLVGGVPRTAIKPHRRHKGADEQKLLKMTLFSGDATNNWKFGVEIWSGILLCFLFVFVCFCHLQQSLHHCMDKRPL